MLRLVAVVATWLLATAVLAPICFFVGLILAGPHAGLLPWVLEVPVVILCYAVLLAVPVWIASKVWRRMS
jgi:hypothetical protein